MAAAKPPHYLYYDFPMDTHIESPPFRIANRVDAKVSFRVGGTLGTFSDACEVTLERANGGPPILLESFNDDGLGDFWLGPGPHEIRSYDVTEAVDRDEVYQLRFRVYDFDGIPDIGWLYIRDVIMSGATILTAGDGNFDGLVDGADYTVWADHFLQTDATWSKGDFNGDRITDGGDYTLWADNYSPVMPLVSAVPEPSTRLLAGLGAVAIAFRVMLQYNLLKRFSAGKR